MANTLHQAAKRRGWHVVAALSLPDATPGSVVMMHLPTNNTTPYSVHLFNAADGSFHAGRYYADVRSAMRMFCEVCAREGVKD